MTKKTILCLTASILLSAFPSHGQLFKNRGNNAKTPQVAVSSGKFNADDPFDKVNLILLPIYGVVPRDWDYQPHRHGTSVERLP